MFSIDDIKGIIANASDPAAPEDFNKATSSNDLVIDDPIINLSGIRNSNDVISLGTAEFTPRELQGYSDLVVHKRPNLLRNNQPYIYKDGGKELSGVSRYCLPGESPTNYCGWFFITTDETYIAITADLDLEEAYAPEFYGGSIPDTPYGVGYQDTCLLENNATLIRLLSAQYLYELSATLSDNWSINKVHTLSFTRAGKADQMRFISLRDDGSIASVSVDRCDEQNVKPKDIYPIVTSWCLTNKVLFDVYTSSLMINGKQVTEKALPGLISKVSHELGINIKTSDFKPTLTSYAINNQYHSLMERYFKLEQLEELELLEPHDHRTFATEFFEIKDDEHRRYADACMQHMLEKLVIRALYPGFPLRSCVILHGPQGVGKSGVLKALCGEEHYDEIQALSKGDAHHGGAGHPDTQKKLSQNNLVVINEIGRALEDLGADSMKDFITSESCSYVDKFQTDITRRGRTAVVAGTTNRANILTDPTGNTRFQLVLCGNTEKIDFDRLEKLQPGILLSALKAVREIAAQGVSALKAHALPDWVLEYSEKQNLEFLSGSEFVGILAPLVSPTTQSGMKASRHTVGMKEISDALNLKPNEVRGAMDEIIRSMKLLGYEKWGKRVRFNGHNNQTVFIKAGTDKPLTRESAHDVMPSGDY